jgi:uncharacterized ubiquitin-like protein YukD
MIYDYIIVGSGITGLYTAYNIKKMFPDKSFLILEQNGKKLIGGKVLQTTFEHNLVFTGSGVARKNKDHHLINLCNELDIKYKEFQTKKTFAFDPIDIKQIYLNLKNNNQNISQTFKEYALPILGEEIYKKFIVTSGFSDYENMDVNVFFNHYNFDDNYDDWIAIYIPWNKLIKKLIDEINIDNIKCNSKVTKIQTENNITVNTVQLNYQCKKLIIASTLNCIQLLLNNPLYNFIEKQSFTRLYVKINKKYIELMKTLVNGTTFVDNALQKIYSIDANKGLYAIAYSDNKNADKLFQKRNDKEYVSNLVKNAFLTKLEDFKINKIECFHWKSGSHYYKPLINYELNEYINLCQHPEKNIFVVGEVIAENSWINSALETFHKISNLI